MDSVLLIGARPPPVGGVATHLGELERALEQRGARVTALDPRRRGPDGRDGRPRLVARLAAAALRGELVHVHTNGHNRGSWVLAALGSAGRALGRPALLTLHSGLAPAFMRAHQTLVRRVCERYSFVVAVNPEIAGVLAGAGVPEERVVVCPAFSPSSLAFRLAPAGLARIRRAHAPLLCSALLPEGPEYGSDVLLDAFVHVHQTHANAGLVLYGPGTRSPAFAAEVARRGLSGAVHLLGELDRPRALAVVAACDLFVRPTRADGDAISVREALALGRPVVASDVGTRPPEATLFASGDAADCAEKIFHIVGNSTASPGSVTASVADCIPTLVELYHRCGLRTAPETTGTPLAMAL